MPSAVLMVEMVVAKTTLNFFLSFVSFIGDADNGVSLEETAVGQEYVKKVEAYFCEVCQRYLSRAEPLEKGLEFHCRSRLHHRAFEERQNGSKVLDEDRTEVRNITSFLLFFYTLKCIISIHI